jgi:hypothetical protein
MPICSGGESSGTGMQGAPEEQCGPPNLLISTHHLQGRAEVRPHLGLLLPPDSSHDEVSSWSEAVQEGIGPSKERFKRQIGHYKGIAPSFLGYIAALDADSSHKSIGPHITACDPHRVGIGVHCGHLWHPQFGCGQSEDACPGPHVEGPLRSFFLQELLEQSKTASCRRMEAAAAGLSHIQGEENGVRGCRGSSATLRRNPNSIRGCKGPKEPSFALGDSGWRLIHPLGERWWLGIREVSGKEPDPMEDPPPGPGGPSPCRDPSDEIPHSLVGIQDLNPLSGQGVEERGQEKGGLCGGLHRDLDPRRPIRASRISLHMEAPLPSSPFPPVSRTVDPTCIKRPYGVKADSV